MGSLQDVHQAATQALEVYRKCRDCPGEYTNLSSGARTLANTFQDIEDAIISRQLSQLQQSELAILLQDCNEVFADLNGLLDKYNALPASSKRTLDRLQWDLGGGDDIKERLGRNIKLASDFYEGLKNDPQARIERALEQLADEISNGRHETESVASLTAVVGDYNCDSGWYQIIRDLGDRGIDENAVTEYRTFIVDWILRAVNSGALTEKIPVSPVETHTRYSLRTPPSSSPSVPPKISRPMSDPVAFAQPAMGYYAPASVSDPSIRQEVSREMKSHGGQLSMEEPPSPIETDFSGMSLVRNAQQVVQHWNRREWTQATKHLKSQIQAVERGVHLEITGTSGQPDIRILRHLMGVAYSFSGDFVQAKEAFEAVLQGLDIQRVRMDDGDIAAAHWLGETCILLNRKLDAALAFAVALHGVAAKYPLRIASNPSGVIPANYLGPRVLEEIRLLNAEANGLNKIRDFFLRLDKDPTTILPRMSRADKFQAVHTAIETLQYERSQHYAHVALPQATNIEQIVILQPLASQPCWPFLLDPFFQNTSAVGILTVLSRPREKFPAGRPSIKRFEPSLQLIELASLVVSN